jgi:hypothetical protein
MREKISGGLGRLHVPFPKLLAAIRQVYEAVVPANLRIGTKTVSLPEIAGAWDLPGKPRVVITIP